MPLLFILVGLSLNAQPPVDGFNKGQGRIDAVVSATYENYGAYFARLNEPVPVGRSSYTASLFVAGGITNWLDIQINAPYIYVNENFNNLQDFTGYLKVCPLNFGLSNDRIVKLLFAAGGSIPMAEYPTESQFSIGQQATMMEGRIILQYNGNKGFFAMAQAGYTHRKEITPISHPFALKFGWAKEKYYLDVWYDQQRAVGGYDYQDWRDDASKRGKEITFRSLGVTYGKLGATYYRPFGKLHGVVGTASYILWGRNIGQNFGLSVGYILRIDLKGNAAD